MMRRRRAVSFRRSSSGGGASAFNGIEGIVIEKHGAANSHAGSIQPAFPAWSPDVLVLSF
jgi:hypothetical protein